MRQRGDLARPQNEENAMQRDLQLVKQGQFEDGLVYLSIVTSIPTLCQYKVVKVWLLDLCLTPK
jgi:hypothetical protein